MRNFYEWLGWLHAKSIRMSLSEKTPTIRMNGYHRLRDMPPGAAMTLLASDGCEYVIMHADDHAHIMALAGLKLGSAISLKDKK